MIIVCEKCHAINFYERFISTFPKCGNKFRDDNKDNLSDDNRDTKKAMKIEKEVIKIISMRKYHPIRIILKITIIKMVIIVEKSKKQVFLI